MSFGRRAGAVLATAFLSLTLLGAGPADADPGKVKQPKRDDSSGVSFRLDTSWGRG